MHLVVVAGLGWKSDSSWFNLWLRTKFGDVDVGVEVPGHLQSTADVPFSMVVSPSKHLLRAICSLCHHVVTACTCVHCIFV